MKGSPTWYHLNHCTRVPSETRRQPHSDKNTEDADSTGGSPEGAGAAEEIETPGRSQETSRPSGSQDTTNALSAALRKGRRRNNTGEKACKQSIFSPVGPESPGLGENNRPATPNDIHVEADLPDRSPPQWDPEIPPTEWEQLFPEIDAYPDGSPVQSKEGAPGEGTERETPQEGGEGRVSQAEEEEDFPTIDFSNLEWSP